MRRSETQTGNSAVTRRLTPRLIVWTSFAAVALGFAFWFDPATVEWVRANQSREMKSFFRAVSWWGDWPSHVVAGLIGAAFAHLLGNRRWIRIFVAMIVACAIAGAVTRVVKMSAGRARPSVHVDAGWNGPRLSSKYHSFPSGHTAASTAFFGALAFASWRAGVLFLPVVLLIAFSRMYMGAHHLSDIVGAAILGLAVAFFVTRSRSFAIGNRQSKIEN